MVDRSAMRKSLNIEASRLFCDGVRKSGDVRDVFPNVKFGACENTDVSKYRSMVGLSSFALFPLLFGRWPGEPRLVLFPPLLIMSGMPVWNVAIPFSCQPPSRKLTTPGALFRKALPRPKGSS